MNRKDETTYEEGPKDPFVPVSDRVRAELRVAMHGISCTECQQSLPGTRLTPAQVSEATGVRLATVRRFVAGLRIKSDDLDAIDRWLSLA